MKRLLIFGLFFCFLLGAKAQDHKTLYSMKGYSLSSINLYEIGGGYTFNSRWTFNSIQLGVSWKKKKIRQEVILTNLSKGVFTEGTMTAPRYIYTGATGFAYQIGYDLLKPEAKWSITSGVGLQANGAFRQTIYGNDPNTQVWTDLWFFLYRPYLITEFSYKINKHWGLNISPLYNFVGLNFFRAKHFKTQDDWTVNTSFYDSWFPREMFVRVGCSYSL